MASDPSIYDRIRPWDAGPGPLVQAGQVGQIRNMMGQGRLQDMQIQKSERDMAEEQQVRDLFRKYPDGKVPINELMSVSPSKGMAFQKSQLDTQETQGKIKKTQLENFGIAAKQLQDVIAQTNGDADMPRVKDTALRLFGPDAMGQANIPAQFSPEWKMTAIQNGERMLAQIEAQKGRDVTMRGQNIGAETARRGQDLTEGRERDLGLQADTARARAAGKTVGESQATAAAALPDTIATADRAIKNVDELLTHPGFKLSVGGTLIPGGRFVPGSAQADWKARFDEIKGGIFMQAYKTLKGGGQITEVEGEKATAAMTRMNTSQSEKEFTAAAREFQSVVKAGVERAKRQAGGAITPQGGGIRFLGFE